MDSKSQHRFLEKVNFHRKLILQAADVLLSLTEAIKHNPAAKTLKLSQTENKAFYAIRDILAKESTLTQYHQVTYHSNYAVGATLHQNIISNPVPIRFYTTKLSEKQKRYSTFNREFLAAYQAVLHFKSQTEGKSLTLLSYWPVEYTNCISAKG